MSQNTSVVVTKDDLGQFASIIGFTALIIGGLGLVWYGGLNPLLIGVFAVGGLALLGWAVITPQEFIGFFTGRQARRGTVAVLSTMVLIAIVVLSYILLERSVLTLDMTNRGDFTLSPDTIAVLENVNRPIRITGFYDSRYVASRDLDDQFFRQYTVETNGLISREYVDPVERPDLQELFNAQNGDVYVYYLNDDGTADMSSVQWVPLGGKQEREMTQAIATLLARGNFTVYFSTGHGELQAEDPSDLGISNAANLLLANGFNVEMANLSELAASGHPVPEDATALVIARPINDFSQPVVEMLDDYLAGGGSLFILADALVNEAPFLAEDSAFNQYLWDNWGIRMLDAVVMDEAAGDPSPWDIYSYAISDLPITASLDPVTDPTSAAQFYTARAIEISTEPPVNNGSAIRSSEISYGETDIARLLQTRSFDASPDEDILGPLTTMAYAANQDTDGKIVLVGDSDFLTNGRITAENARGNGFLFMDSMGWMTGFTEQVSIAPQATSVGQVLIFVSPDTLDRISFVTMLLLPALVLAVGVGVWFMRARG